MASNILNEFRPEVTPEVIEETSAADARVERGSL
jgi:hypothetical protein